MPKFLRFLLAGLPAAVFAVPLNIFLVEMLTLSKPVSYALVLCVQIVVNFFICRSYVFGESGAPLWLVFSRFFFAIGLIRLLDWLAYFFLLPYFGRWYALIQLGNLVIFSVLKFFLARFALETPARRKSL